MPLLSTRGAASSKALGQLSVVPAVQAEAIDFDGTNDYLSRASDLTGNANGNTFTFSAWVWRGNQALQYIYNSCELSSSTRFSVEVTNGLVRVIGKNTSGTTIFSVTSTLVIALQTWTSVIVSGNNNTNVLDIAINDVTERISDAFTSTNSIAFAQPIHNVAQFNGDEMQTRLSNVFLDYTYRDLSVTANRRLFVTADLKPAAGQAALNPILYLPMNDPTAPGTNAGTGGNFTLTGTVARSGRGPNQYNVPYSDLDGTADYLSRTTAPTGIADGKAFTVSCNVNADSVPSIAYIVSFGSGALQRLEISISNGDFFFRAFNSAGTTIFQARTSSPKLVIGRNYNMVASFDLSDTAKRFIYVNGQAATVTWTTYTNDNIDFDIASSPGYRVGLSTTGNDYFNGRIGALWFNTSYIDLSVAGNLAKFVTGTGIDAKPVDLGASGELPTGTSPLIYLPMYGNNAGKNYGTGGDFTVNSGPYTGARGPNEFWGNKADFNGSSGYLSRTSPLSGVSNGGTFSLSVWTSRDVSAVLNRIFSNGVKLLVYLGSDDKYYFIASDTSGSTLLSASTDSTFATNAVRQILVCIDLANTSKRFVYIDGVSQSMTWTTYVAGNIALTSVNSTERLAIGALYNSSASGFLDGTISELYFTTDYIDFSQEANRLKFRDAFGYPVNLTQQITANSIPNPAIYMRFPPTSFGTNSGTGGDFTVNGTITDGGQL